ncbi:heme peroxidase [Roridomyces roridus]|uniref:Peroxidase n=1 Tax=Roridomyces roridus TaxID=1738132 RepID=A0AAD7BCT0_9AGAR|nr:heme peroxidase [Roridomyces roridus]
MNVLLTLTYLSAVRGYTWPSPQLDALETVRFNQEGFNAGGLAALIQPCTAYIFGGPNTGRSDAADWIRTAYHDMATYNKSDGTGGMDASIRFIEEQERPENAGNGFDNTVIAMNSQINRYVSIADSLALAAIVAIENCGGPEIAFRGGRSDAGEPNAPGVPLPEQSLETHIAAFARQGFTPTEMIGLVACGHTFGGVQHDAFPDIVGELDDPTSIDDVAHFDSTFVTFDNAIATEYISGTTRSPLIVGANDTTNSDKQIFSSDGNTTILSFATSAEVYTSTCADLFARMLDTVPAGVELTEVITPLPIKPSSVEFVMNQDTMELSGQVRLWNTTEDPSLIVQLQWSDHLGETHTTGPLGFLGTSSSTGGKYSAVWYTFNSSSIHLDPAAGVRSLSFLINGVLEDQNGLGFAVQDAFMISSTSCQIENPPSGRIDVAVRNGVNVTRLYLEEMTTDNVGRPIVVELDITPPASPVAANPAYTVWSMNLTDPNALYGIGAQIGGVNYSTTDQHRFVEFEVC